MKESKVLKAVSYIVLMISISTLLISIFMTSIKENDYYDKDKYFNSNTFASTYIGYLGNDAYDLIHNNNTYQSILDGDTEIYYSTRTRDYYSYIKDRYFLIIYKNKALTNVELTNTTNTIEGIKLYIKNNENAKNVNIINAEIHSESDIIQKVGIQYLSNLTEVYYTRTDGGIEYITVEAKDFEIYSSFVEEFKDNSQMAVVNNLIEKLLPYEEYEYFVIPVSSILIVLILLYLIISIGYKKGVEGIALNDFDKIPLEIIIFIAMTIGCIPFAMLSEINANYNAIISLIITAYFLIYILCAITFTTIIKRIKSKTFWKSTLVGKTILWIGKCLNKINDKLISGWETLTYSTNVTNKVLIYFLSIIVIGIVILLMFGNSFMTLLLEMILLAFVAYKIIKALKGFSQIENKLKEMYEGNNQNSLNKEDFGPELQNTVKYINDISNGFENAIQDRIKSERLKAELITNVSHDIKTPLTSIINYVDLLKQEDIQNEKVKEYIGILDNKSQRLKKLTEDLVEASKVSTGNISLNLENINIVELIKQALGEFEDKFKKRGLEAILESKDSEIIINADNRYMYRIIENLFSNISKYALENSRVYIDIKKTQKNVLIEMKNISKDRLNISADELMQRFVRGDKSRNTEGSGLGISIAQNLTELQGGEFRLKLDGDLFKVELEWKIGDGPFFHEFKDRPQIRENGDRHLK